MAGSQVIVLIRDDGAVDRGVGEILLVKGVHLVGKELQLLLIQLGIQLGGGALGFGLSLLLLAFYLYVLLVDFKTVSQAVRAGMPQIYEWYLGYSILLTLVLVYLEVLRILNYLSRRNG